jgi:hypothetical protein
MSLTGVADSGSMNVSAEQRETRREHTREERRKNTLDSDRMLTAMIIDHNHDPLVKRGQLKYKVIP